MFIKHLHKFFNQDNGAPAGGAAPTQPTAPAARTEAAPAVISDWNNVIAGSVSDEQLIESVFGGNDPFAAPDPSQHQNQSRYPPNPYQNQGAPPTNTPTQPATPASAQAAPQAQAQPPQATQPQTPAAAATPPTAPTPTDHRAAVAKFKTESPDPAIQAEGYAELAEIAKSRVTQQAAPNRQVPAAPTFQPFDEAAAATKARTDVETRLYQQTRKPLRDEDGHVLFDPETDQPRYETKQETLTRLRKENGLLFDTHIEDKTEAQLAKMRSEHEQSAQSAMLEHYQAESIDRAIWDAAADAIFDLLPSERIGDNAVKTETLQQYQPFAKALVATRLDEILLPENQAVIQQKFGNMTPQQRTDFIVKAARLAATSDLKKFIESTGKRFTPQAAPAAAQQQAPQQRQGQQQPQFQVPPTQQQQQQGQQQQPPVQPPQQQYANAPALGTPGASPFKPQTPESQTQQLFDPNRRTYGEIAALSDEQVAAQINW